jgi:hypothetical protein
MAFPLKNPFNITKAVDFDDQQINNYWVEIPNGEGSFREMFKPTSPMPIILLGGKGSGKTHLMRYFSYPLQKIRHSDDIVGGITKDGYLGVYFRCTGLNAGRFSGKSQSNEIWASVFSYYMELWFAQQLLRIIRDLFQKNAELEAKEVQISKQIASLFDSMPIGDFSTLKGILDVYEKLQREIDIEVNNCASTGSMNIRIIVTRGRLVFGIPQILSKELSPLSNALFLYLVDEFENLDELQQKYINTLVREKEIPTSFRIGGRLYGVKTWFTLSADEANKEGSEHEIVYLDELLRKNKHYDKFSEHLIIRRLHEAEILPSLSVTKKVNLNSFFDTYSNSPFGDEETAFVKENYSPKQRPYFVSLERKLIRGVKSSVAWGISEKNIEEDISKIIGNLAVSDHPLLEKANILLFYQNWYKKNNLITSSEIIQEECKKYLATPNEPSHYHEKLLHFRADLLAQLYRECKQPQKYFGLNTFIEMSQGMPRNLLIILKEIFKWSLFNGEIPFGEKPISLMSQKSGISDATDWFFRDARITGTSGPEIQKCINQLLELFREVRFADKPSECSPCTFSANILECTQKAKENILLAEKYSLLILVASGQKDKNSKRVDWKYQINSMLSPKYDLPIYRRGALTLSSAEINSIFDPACFDEFENIRKTIKERMSAPYYGRKGADNDKTGTLF